MNPFTDEYLKQEVDFYGVNGPVKTGDMQISMVRPKSRCDDYLNVNYHLDPGFDVPVLVRDGTVWMSLTWMEVQSACVPIKRARGRAATVGLGLGYFALRAIAKPEVKSLTIFECDEGTIAWFTNAFKYRDGFDKIRIVHGDARQTFKGYEFDSVFVDPYPTICPDEVVDDIELFCGNNRIGDYRFWCQERVQFDAIDHHGMYVDVGDDGRWLYSRWQESEGSSMRRFILDYNYVREVLNALEHAKRANLHQGSAQRV